MQYVEESANATIPTAPAWKIPLRTSPDSDHSDSDSDYDIAASCPKIHIDRPRFNFQKELFHPAYEETREITREYLEEAMRKAISIIPVDTGLLRDTIIYGKGTFTLPGNLSMQASSRHDDSPKWRPNKYSADKRKRIRKQAVTEYLNGETYYNIAKKFGTTRETIQRWVNQAKKK